MQITDLKSRLARVPFRPFLIELENGTHVLVGQNSELFFPRQRPEVVIAFTDGIQHEFEIDRVTQLVEA